MTKPLVRAEGIVSNDDFTKFLVQCDSEESFYRIPGGGVEFGETAAEAIQREFIEEFELYVNVGELAIANESLLEYDGAKRHNVNLLYWCKLENTHNPFEYLQMVVLICIFMFLVVLGVISIDVSLKKKLKNDESIINRLDLILGKIDSGINKDNSKQENNQWSKIF